MRRKFSSWFPTSSTRKTLGEVSSFAAVNRETVPYSLPIVWYGKNCMAGRGDRFLWISFMIRPLTISTFVRLRDRVWRVRLPQA
jgi:hypothetical protein